MKDLFDDDLFDNITDTETAFSELIHEQCINNIFKKFNNWKNTLSVNLAKLSGYIYNEYCKRYGSIDKWLSIEPDSQINAVTLKVKPFPEYKLAQLGIVDVSLFMSLSINKIEVDYALGFPAGSIILFTNIMDNNVHITKEFVNKLEEITEIRNKADIENNAPKEIMFQNLTFDLETLDMLRDLNSFVFIFGPDCKYKEEVIWPGMEGEVAEFPVAMKLNSLNINNENYNFKQYTIPIIEVKTSLWPSYSYYH